MIKIFQIEVAPEDEFAFDRSIKQIADTVVNFSATRRGQIISFHVMKSDIDNMTNKYCAIVEGVLADDIFQLITETSGLAQPVIFPDSLQTTSIGDFVSFEKWPKSTWDLESS